MTKILTLKCKCQDVIDSIATYDSLHASRQFKTHFLLKVLLISLLFCCYLLLKPSWPGLEAFYFGNNIYTPYNVTILVNVRLAKASCSNNLPNWTATATMIDLQYCFTLHCATAWSNLDSEKLFFCWHGFGAVTYQEYQEHVRVQYCTVLRICTVHMYVMSGTTKRKNGTPVCVSLYGAVVAYFLYMHNTSKYL